MLSLLLKYRKPCVLALLALLGLACGNLAATLLGMRLSRGALPQAAGAAPVRPTAAADPAADLAAILQHHPFDATARTATPGVFILQAGANGEGTAVRSDLELLGTVVAGSRSLALIRTGQELKNYHLDEEIPGGRIEEIIRHQVTIRNHNSSLTILRMFEEGATGLDRSRTNGASTAATESGGTALSRSPLRTRSQPPERETAGVQATGVVRSVGANRWVVARSAAEAARENVGEQLRTALIQPNLVNGKTNGFVVKSIQPGTLLAQMGLQPGDVLKRVNQTPLDSPEKALQIMQQLREARQLSIDLERGGKPLSFVYEIE